MSLKEELQQARMNNLEDIRCIIDEYEWYEKELIEEREKRIKYEKILEWYCKKYWIKLVEYNMWGIDRPKTLWVSIQFWDNGIYYA